MDNYFISFHFFVCLPTFEQEVCSTKMGYANTLSLGTNSWKKRNVTTLNNTVCIKQKCCVACVTGKNDKRVFYIASSEFCQLNRNLFDIRTKLQESIFKSNNQVNFTVTTRTLVLSKEWIRMWSNTGLVLNETMVVVHVCFNGRCCSSKPVGIVLN